MNFARFHGEGRISIEQGPELVPGHDELLVRVKACALCGSELRQWRNGWPVTPGHEVFGVIDAPQHPRHGQRVVVYIPVFCNACDDCSSGRTHLCSSRTLIGWQRNGGYADQLVAPERCLLEVPDDISDVLAPLLLDVIGTTAHGVRLAQKVVDHGKALVVGAGPIGLGAILVLRDMGFGSIDVIDPVSYRSGFAASLGATVSSAESAASGRYRIVVEASGKDAGRQLALEAVGPEGAVIQIGESDAWSIKETRSIRLKDFYLVRSFYFPRTDFAQNIEILRNNREDFGRLVDETVPLEGLEGLFDIFAQGKRLKPLTCPS
ncbi:MAG: alcohol dehydrogenase catalytic domain-containing protein [Hyphomicrobiales bacterium]|nr:alcohol dehydrogenase catalytic domain-containing protein [Hyphomicrobiales bacterium]